MEWTEAIKRFCHHDALRPCFRAARPRGMRILWPQSLWAGLHLQCRERATAADIELTQFSSSSLLVPQKTSLQLERSIKRGRDLLKHLAITPTPGFNIKVVNVGKDLPWDVKNTHSQFSCRKMSCLVGQNNTVCLDFDDQLCFSQPA